MKPVETLSFLELLQSFRRGELLVELDDALEETIAAIEATGGSGAITLRLPLKLNKAGQIEVIPEVVVKKPRKAIGTGIFFPVEGRLARRDPAQLDLIDELEARRSRGDVN